MQLLMFYLFGFGALFGALSCVLARQPIMSALFLIVNMLSLAGLYAVLNAHLIAALQIIVYAGAIIVLTLFVIMLLNMREKEGLAYGHKVVLQAAGIVVVAFVFVGIASKAGNLAIATGGAELSAGFGTVVEVGKVMFTEYILTFEIASVLLLVALIGAVVLSKARV